MNTQELVEDLIDKYGEWLEMAEDNAPSLLIEIIGQLLIKEREEKEFYKKAAYGKS